MQNSRRGLTLLCTATQNLTLKSALPGLQAVTGAVVATQRLLHAGQVQQARNRKPHSGNVSALFKPVQVKHNADEVDVGSELAGKLEKSAILKILNKFTQRREIKALCTENGLDSESKQLKVFTFR